jgi:uncharacterized membrane protein (Fun14 family)
MSLGQKMKKASFWINATKVGFVFLIAITIVSLLIYSFKDVLSFNWDAVAETNFKNGQWKRFFASKVVASIFYGMFIAFKNTK